MRREGVRVSDGFLHDMALTAILTRRFVARDVVSS